MLKGLARYCGAHSQSDMCYRVQAINKFKIVYWSYGSNGQKSNE